MADDADSGERTEEATAQRREDFRKQGQVVQSKEIASVLTLLGSAIVIWALGRFFLAQVTETYQVLFGDQIHSVTRAGNVGPAIKFAVTKAFLMTAPILLITAVMGFAATIFQIGFLYNEEALDFKFERMDPVEGFKRMFSMRAWVEGLKAVIKVLIVAAIAWSILKVELKAAPLLINLSPAELLSHIGSVSMRLVFGIGTFMAFVAALDYGYLRWDLEKRMRMTKQEVKEEHKAREGDPLIKSRIRRLQREVANRRMMKDVPKADVVITNPTHIAVALKYDETMPAPKLLAKGAGLIAEKIKELAKENGIPVMENKPLARTIYKTLKIGQLVPRELYQAVAEVLAFVYKLKRKAVR